MKRYNVQIVLVALVGILAACGQVAEEALELQAAPSFAPEIYADGEVWGTKVVTTLPVPKGKNLQSFDKFFIVLNTNADGQLPVSEAAPGNPDYNGGRWFTHTVEWTQDGFDAHGTVPVLTSYEDIMFHADLGHLTIAEGSFDGGPPPYFSCPLLPVK